MRGKHKNDNLPDAVPDAGGVAFPIVGIGASAGGLEALKAFFSTMPPDSGLAFVVIQHLEPTHESHMAEILGRATPMRVVQAKDGQIVEPNRVYTNPPGKVLSLRKGRLILDGPDAHGHVEAAIDRFLISLAEEQTSISVILSGSTGTDSVRGVRAVRAVGGLCMVQTPLTAQFGAMPQAVIDAGLADSVLDPEKMPAAILQFIHHPLVQSIGPEGPIPIESEAGVETILKLLKIEAGSDYTHYKRAMLGRRIARRMGLLQIPAMDVYIALLRKDRQEVSLLARDVLIGVSSFFRDPTVFETLSRDVVEPLVRAQPDGVPLRAWVAGCSTGEEAYTIAMLLLEARAAAGRKNAIQVFATDLDEASLATARAGVYPLDVAHDITEARLKAFFTPKDDRYQVAKHLREVVVFSRHNLLSDPPFSKLDLLCCRNVLIYLDPVAQKKAMSAFSFALKAGGHLLLGKSESASGMTDIFGLISSQDHLYQRLRTGRQAADVLPPYTTTGRPSAQATCAPERAIGDASVLSQSNLEAIIRHFDASVVLIETDGTILYFHGNTEKYLGHPKGRASLSIFDLTGGALSARLRRTITIALQQDEPVCLLQVPLPHRPEVLTNLTVTRMSARSGPPLLAIIFEDAQPLPRSASAQSMTLREESLVESLESEGKALRAELRARVEAGNMAEKELTSANEEMMSMNEELQSANEELEASKEELQSFNEELGIVNSQLNEKVGELTATTNDLANLLGASDIATVILDTRLKIRRFTPRTTVLMNLIAEDIGRPIGHITHTFTGVDLALDAGRVLSSFIPVEQELQARDGRWYSVNILPYRTLNNRVEGIVITFTNVTRLKQTERQLRREKEYAERIIETVRHPLLVLDGALKVLSANQAFYQIFQVNPAHTAGVMVYDLGNGQWNIPALRVLLEEVIPQESAFIDFRVEHVFEQIGRKIMLISGQRIAPFGDMPERLLVTVEDVTESEQNRDELQLLNADLEQRVEQRTALVTQRELQLRELAVRLTPTEQAERERLARLLHDDFQQILVAIGFQLATLRASVSDETSKAAFAAMDDMLRQLVASSRSLSSDLCPAILYESGLDAALPGLANRMFKQHKLKVTTEINTTVPADDNGVVVVLFSAVSELLLNVVKHARTDSALVKLDRIDDNRIRIVVSDQGDGFAPAILDTAESAATWLGLLGMKQRLELVGGTCDIDSAPGRGTRITLTADVGRPRQADETRRTASALQNIPADEPVAPTQTGDRIRVLLADDHAVVRKGLADALGGEPDIAVVAAACDGIQAIEWARLHQPDVIIMDISMPRKNGIEATQAIMKERPDTKIIGYSMYQQEDRAMAMQEAGAVGYVSKDAPLEDLLAAIRKNVRQKKRTK